jgi:hypothetical protein
MKKLAISLTALLFVFSATEALAQGSAGNGSIKVNKDELEHVKPFKARRIIQIVREDPEIHDTRPPIEEPASLELNLQPVPVIPGKKYVYGDPAGGGNGSNNGGNNVIQLSGQGNDLPQAGFTRYFNGTKPQASKGLPSGQSVPVVDTGSPLYQARKTVDGTLKPGGNPAKRMQAMSYQDYRSRGGASSGASRVEASATGKIIGQNKHPLLNKLSGTNK